LLSQSLIAVLSFTEAIQLFQGGQDYLEIFDAAHSEDEDRFIATREVHRGIAVVICTERDDDVVRIIRARMATNREREDLQDHMASVQMSDIPEVSDEQFRSAIPAKLRARLARGGPASGKDIAALGRFLGLSQTEFARAIEISVHSLRNREPTCQVTN